MIQTSEQARKYIKWQFRNIIMPHVPVEQARTAEYALDGALRYYDQPHRVYHDIKHVANVLRQLTHKRWNLSPVDYATAFVALLLHDVIYQIPAPTDASNEAKSADYAAKFIDNCGIGWLVDTFTVQSAIVATKGHQPATYLEMVVCWCDLWDLAGDADTVELNRRKIEGEYRKVYSAEEYVAGRLAFLDSYKDPFKTPPRISTYWWLYSGWLNIKADINLDRERRLLTKGTRA